MSNCFCCCLHLGTMWHLTQESLKFCMRSGEVISHGKEEEKPDQKELKYACFYLEDTAAMGS